MRNLEELLLLFLGNVGRRLAQWADNRLELDHLRLLDRFAELSPKAPKITSQFF